MTSTAAIDRGGSWPTYLSYERPPVALEQGEPEGNPCAACDVDELAHAAYAATKNLGTGTMHDFAAQQMALAGGHHLSASLAFEPLCRGAAGLAGLVGSSLCVAPLAVMAMKAGLHEWREAPELARQFAAAQAARRAERAHAAGLPEATRRRLSRELAAFGVEHDAHSALIDRAARGARFGGAIGKYAFLSGAAILGRVAFELARNVGGAAVAGTPDVDGAAKKRKLDGTFLTGTGVAANACGCLAAGFAVMLGHNFVRKSRLYQEKWRADAPRLERKRAGLEGTAYGRFIEKKALARRAFAGAFLGKNVAFAVGAGLYAAGTILPSCVKTLAAVGVLDSKKVGANLILGLFATAIAGAGVMGVFSHQFFVGHPKLERYEQYEFKDPVELDRRFLTSIDEFPLRDAATGKRLPARETTRLGAATRAAAFEAVQACERARASIVGAAASAVGCAAPETLHVEDEGYRAPTVASSIKRFLGARKLTGRLFAAPELRPEVLEAWLERPEARPLVLARLGEILDAKTAYLETKLALQRRMIGQTIAAAAPDAPKEREALYAHAENASGSYGAAQRLRDGYRAARTGLGEAATRPEAYERRVSDALNALERTVDAAVDREKAEEQEALRGKPLPERLATYLGETLAEHHRNDRGLLLEIEAQAGRHIPETHDMRLPFLARA